jgi:COP9 signalosome complex subunit 3
VAPLRLLALAISRLDSSLGTFTSSHLLFVRACLATHSFEEALPIIEHDIHSFAPKQAPAGTFPCSQHHLSNGYITIKSGLTNSITVQDVQEYQLLSAMIYIGLKKWAEAQYHLDHVLSTPTNNTANALMLEAYRKWLLVSLLVEGKVGSSPKTSSSNAVKTIRSLVKNYEAIVEAFKRTDPARMNAEAQEAQNQFDEVNHICNESDVTLLTCLRMGTTV